MRRLSKILRGMILVLPLALIFSYHPVMTLGVGETVNFELSVPLIWLVVFDVVGVVAMVSERKLRVVVKWWKWLVFPAFVTMSLMWSANLVRGVLTVGVMWLVVFALMIIAVFKEWLFAEDFRKKFLKWLFGATLFVCLWCVVQCVMDLAGVSREYSLMCLGCTSKMFGFPHPNGFAIEPQFMGNLLLAPALVAAVFLMKDAVSTSFRAASFLGLRFLLPCFFIITATLFLVFSRGAIYAFIVGMMFMSGWVLVRERKRVVGVLKCVVVMWGLVVVAFLFTLNLQGVMAQVGPTNDTYVDGVAKALNQLSLGVIDIRGQKGDTIENGVVSEESVEKPVENFEDNREELSGNEEAIFDGYVEESTEIRKMLTRSALALWRSEARTMLIGVGIGGAGQAMYEAGLIDSPKEIVQNEYASVLLEVGIVGVSLLGWMLIMIIRMVVKSGASAVLMLALMVAYGVSLLFFSGFANALQIYLLPAVIWAICRKF